VPESQLALAVLAPIAFVAALVYGLTGFGSALVAIPLATHFVSLPFALAVFVLVDLANTVRVGLEAPRHIARAELLRVAPLIPVGTIFGVTVLVNLPRAGAMLALGVFIIAFALYSLIARGPRATVRRGWAYLAGFAGGISSALFGAGGPPYAIYLAHRGLTKEAFRATLSATIGVSVTTRLIAFFVIGAMSSARVWLAAAIALPAALLGVSLASRAFARIDRETVMRVIALLLLASGGSLIARAVGQG
jgi:uncharacterized membrane protein YfcA